MELKEAINKLNETCKQCHNSKECWDNEFCPDCYVEVEDIFAIETVLKALEDYKKENEELKNIDLTTVYLKGVSDEKERWRNKIREKIKRLEEEEKAELSEFEKRKRLVLPTDTPYLFASTEYSWKKEVLNNLLKEE